MSIGENIKKYRKQKDLTQKELGKLIEGSTGTIQQYELGKRTPRIEQLKKIAEVLEVNIDALLDIKDIKESINNNKEIIKEKRKVDRTLSYEEYENLERENAILQSELESRLIQSLSLRKEKQEFLYDILKKMGYQITESEDSWHFVTIKKDEQESNIDIANLEKLSDEIRDFIQFKMTQIIN